MAVCFTSLKIVLSYLLWIQLVIQFEALGKEPDAYVYAEVFGSSVDMSVISLLVALNAFLFSMKLLTASTDTSATSRSAAAAAPVEKAAQDTTKAAPVAAKTSVTVGDATKMVGNRAGSKNTLDVVLVGCGMPKKGMGWYHLTQLLDMTSVNMRAVVEPFFMNKSLCATVPPPFAELVDSLAEKSVPCVDSVSSLPKFTNQTMCLIAGRTNDNPKFFRECIENGAKIIFLEKPGAPSVAELEAMSVLAKEKGVKVYLGYNKNVTPYVQKALTKSKTVNGSHVVFCHNNSYKVNDLNECFSRNSEGMLKNMAIHELALLVTFFDITVDNIKSFTVNKNKLFTESLTVWAPGTSMPNPTYITDFAKVGFTVTNKSNQTVSVMADRCGGNVSFASVKDKSGAEIEKFEFPDAATQKKVDKQCADDPEMMPYFFVQSDDYWVLKERVVKSALNNVKAESIATIEIAIEALKLAEYFTKEINSALKE